MTPIERVAAITCICGDAPVVLTIIDHRLGARADYCADCVPKHQATIERLRVALGDAVEHMQWMTGGINLGVRVEKETLVLIRAGIDKARAALQAEATGEGEKHGSAQIHN